MHLFCCLRSAGSALFPDPAQHVLCKKHKSLQVPWIIYIFSYTLHQYWGIRCRKSG